MNATQLSQLNAAIAYNRKQQIEVLKTLRAQGVEVLVSLRGCARAIADEIKRLINVYSKAVKEVVKAAETAAKATIAYWAAKPVKSLNPRAVSGAIALSLKLGF
jgi:hypothetical protein